MQQMITGIEQIIKSINNNYSSLKIYNILGDLYWMTGYIHKAINCHIKSGEIINYLLNNLKRDTSLHFKLELEEFHCSYLLNMALCKIDFGELKESEAFLKKLLSESKNHMKTQISACFCLAFVNSCLGYKNIALDFAQKSQEFQWDKLGSWTTGYGFIFLGLTYKNLESIEKSFEMYYKAIDLAETIHYTQVKAKALTGLAELYREQVDFEKALSHHSKSIEFLDKIGAKCDLAEAYYQIALTYQKMGNAENSQENFDKAIRLFNEMEAPRQVEKVQRSIGGK